MSEEKNDGFNGTMKRVFQCSIAMTYVIIAVIAAGCTDALADVPQPETTPVITPAATAAAPVHTTAVTSVPTTPSCANPPLNPWTGVPESYHTTLTDKEKLPAPGMLVSRADLFGTPSLNWNSYTATIHYSNNDETGGPVTTESSRKTEITKEDYQGKNAIHKKETWIFRVTEPSPSPEQTTIDDTYYDEQNIVLHQHRKVITSGTVYEDRDIPVTAADGSPDCSGELWVPKYAYSGIDPVTVPAGSYPDAMKFTKNTADTSSTGTATVTCWFAPDVPVEVKRVIEEHEKGSVTTIELTGWG